jgi:phenylacetate-CoA ligase
MNQATNILKSSPDLFHPASSLDYVPAPQLGRLQSQRLRAVLRRAYEQVPMYRQRFDDHGVRLDDVRSIDDLPRLPFTGKADLGDAYPFGLFAVGMGEIVRLHTSTGTRGKPIVLAYTREDLEVWTSVMVRTLACFGLHRGDVVQNAYDYGLSTGGLGFHYGAEALGASVVPVSSGGTDRQILVLSNFGVSAICCAPSSFLRILDRAEELNVDLRKLPLRVGAFGAEPWTDALRRRFQEAAGIKAFDVYGLSEIVGPGVAAECVLQDGLHVFEDHFYPEIVDPVSGESLPEGAAGELVLTTLSKHAMPMVRYRTGDVTSIAAEPCACGRTMRRIRRIRRRCDDTFVIRGVNVAPAQIEDALPAVGGIRPHFQLVLTRPRGVDELEVRIEVTPAVFRDRIGALEEFQSAAVRQIEQALGLRVPVNLVEPHAISRSEGAPQRVVDQRDREGSDPETCR